jgi:hypothetical protein
MSNTSRPSPAVIAAAVVAILGGLLILLGCSLAFLGVLLQGSAYNTPGTPPFLRNFTLGTMGFMMCLSLFGGVTGIGLIYLRNWARISVLIWGGCSAFFGAIGVAMAFLISAGFPSNAAQLPAESLRLMRVILFCIYGLPLIVGVWWLILFNRKSVKAQFAGTVGAVDPGVPQKPRCPLPVAVVAWLYVTSLLNLLFLPFTSVHAPVFLFGMLLPDKVGMGVLILTCMVFTVCGIGMLRLKPWSYSLTLGLQVFWLTSTVVSVFRPNYKAAMESFLEQMRTSMQLPTTQFNPNYYLQYFGWMMAIGLLLAAAVLGLLIYYRRRFLEAASAAATSR